MTGTLGDRGRERLVSRAASLARLCDARTVQPTLRVLLGRSTYPRGRAVRAVRSSADCRERVESVAFALGNLLLTRFSSLCPD